MQKLNQAIDERNMDICQLKVQCMNGADQQQHLLQYQLPPHQMQNQQQHQELLQVL